MKQILKFSLLLISLIIFNGCDKPAPTQLIQEDDPLEVELLAIDTENEFYSSEYDSTGFIYKPSRGLLNIITVSGIKLTYNNATHSTSHAQAIFFNKDSIVLAPDNTLLGFKTRILGAVEFNNKKAKLREFRIRFKDKRIGNQADTLLGYRHVLHHNPFLPNDYFSFQYNSTVNFNIDPLIGSPVSFDIHTASEINGSVHFEKTGNSYKSILSWNAGGYEKFEIIIGGIHRGSGKAFPLYRIKTRDDGSLYIPQNLLSKIPYNRFQRLIFSIIRKKEFYENSSNELYVLSQSIHNIVIDIP